MSSHDSRTAGLAPVALSILTLFSASPLAAPMAATRLAPAPVRVRASDPPLRRGGAPNGVRLTAGVNNDYFGAGVLSADPLSTFGSVFRIDASGEVVVLHDFSGADGARPSGLVTLARDGFVYGTTAAGGAHGAGTVYRVRPDGSGFATVYAFTGQADGAIPSAGLLETRSGALVGTASAGGVNGRGVVFQVSSGTFAVLHDFTSVEGAAPSAALYESPAGLLIGTTRLGGTSDVGTVFAMKPNGSTFRTLHQFTPTEGGGPDSELVRASDGLLYGTASGGGLFDNGTIYRIALDGTRFDRVRAFDASARITSQLGDKSHPVSVALGPDGRLYGTTLTGTTYRGGEVFSLRVDTAAYAVMSGFQTAGDPRAGLVRGSDGALYVPVYDTAAGRTAAVMHLQPLSVGGAKVATTPASTEVLGPPDVDSAQKTEAPSGAVCVNPWATATAYPIIIGRYAFAQVGEDLYVIGGVSNGAIVATANRYNAGTNTWTPIADFLAPGEAAAATTIGGKIYATQGSNGNGFSIYDIGTNAWSAGPAIPNPQSNRYGAAAGSFNGNVFVVGGGNAPSTDVEVYNIAGNTWSAGTAAPSGYQVGGYVQVGQYLYCVGSYGASSSANSTVAMRLDMSSAPGVWTVGPAWTPGRADFGLASMGTKIFAIGGDLQAGGFFDASTDVDELDTSAWPGGAWVASPPVLPSIRQANQAGFLSTTGRAGGEIWSTGGIFGRNTHTWINEHLYRSTGVDTTPPTITCPPNITVGESPMGSGSAVVNYTATATDSCSTPVVTCVPASGSTFTLGTTSVTCTAVDGNQNQSSCSFTVSVVVSTFTNCCVDDATGNVLSIDADPASAGYGTWQLTFADGSPSLMGVAEHVSYIPGHSLIASDHDSPTVAMDMYINFGARTCVGKVQNRITGAQYVIRDRNITNNPPCGAPPPPPPG